MDLKPSPNREGENPFTKAAPKVSDDTSLSAIPERVEQPPSSVRDLRNKSDIYKST